MSDTPPPYTGSDIGEPATVTEYVQTGPGPRRRTLRTAVQVLIAVLLAVPAALGALTAAGVELPTGAIVGITGAAVVLISAGQNAYDQQRGDH